MRIFRDAVLLIAICSQLIFIAGIQTTAAMFSTSSPIYIRTSGVEPPTAPILSLDNVTYTISSDIYTTSEDFGIVIEKDDIVVDGAGHIIERVQGPLGQKIGIYLAMRSNVTIKNMRIRSFAYSIFLNGSSYNNVVENQMSQTGGWVLYLWSYSNFNNILDNTISGGYSGIVLYDNCFHNTIVGNNVTYNSYGICFKTSSENIIYHNNFNGNEDEVWYLSSCTNTWDNGYPSGGNYWWDYTASHGGADADGDGIGDTPYIISLNDQDNYPLMEPFIVPEFPSFLILSLFMLATLLAVTFYKKKHACLRQ